MLLVLPNGTPLGRHSGLLERPESEYRPSPLAGDTRRSRADARRDARSEQMHLP